MGGGAECEAEHGAEAVLGVGVLWWETCTLIPVLVP